MEKPTDITHTRNLDIMENVDMESYKRFRNCPFCGEDNDEFRSAFPDIGEENWPEITLAAECESCGKKWDEVYYLKELYIRYK